MPYCSAFKLQENEAKNCSYPLRLDVYGSGCDHNCAYCYARAQMIVGGWNNSKNVKHPFPRVADLDCIRKTLLELPNSQPKCVSKHWKKIRPLLVKKLPLRIGAVTDCFQRYMESKAHAGLELLKILTEAQYPAQIVTKSDIIAEPEYIEAMKNNEDNLLLQISITSGSDSISKVLESGAPPTSKRLDALSKLVKNGFYTSVRINPLFPIYPDGTLVKIANNSNLGELEIFEKASEKMDVQTLPVFNFDLIDDVLSIFEHAPIQTKGKHTIIAGFVRLPFGCTKWVSEALRWKPEELKKFFNIKKGNCYYYSSEEIRFYYNAINELCKKTNVPFSVCYDFEENCTKFRNMWANPKDCCNGIGTVKGFKKVFSDCC